MITSLNNIGAGGETRTHVGFPTAYKTVAIAAMRHQRYNIKYIYYTKKGQPKNARSL